MSRTAANAAAAAPAPARPRHVPARTCVGCRTVRPRNELLRLVLPEAGPVALDPTGRRNGRGAWLCAAHPTDCLALARRKRALQRAFRTTPDRVDTDALAAELAGPTT